MNRKATGVMDQWLTLGELAELFGGHINEVAEHSETISALRDRPEAESLLIIIDVTKKEDIERIAKDNQFVD